MNVHGYRGGCSPGECVGPPWTPAWEVTGVFTALVKPFGHTVSCVTPCRKDSLPSSAFTFYFSYVWLVFGDINHNPQKRKNYKLHFSPHY